MKTLTKIILIILCITLLSSTQLLGQEWSAEQKDVWTTVENWWQVWSEGNIDKINGLVAQDFRGWREDSKVTYTKKSVQPWWEDWLQKFKAPNIYLLHPFAIDIHGDIAIVFYSFTARNKLKDGSEINETGKWTDVYRKINGKWLIISETGFNFNSSKN